MRNLICRNECWGVFSLVGQKWRGCGDGVSTPRGGRSFLCVDTSSNELVFSVWCNNETSYLPVLLILANVLNLVVGWQSEMFAMTEYFGEFALARWGPLSKFLRHLLFLVLSAVSRVHWDCFCVCVCVCVFAVCMSDLPVHYGFIWSIIHTLFRYIYIYKIMIPINAHTAVCGTIYIKTISFEWWITEWNILRIPSNQISRHSYCNNIYLCIFKLWVLVIVITPIDWFW